MAYARFFDSDVYIYLSARGLMCQECRLIEDDFAESMFTADSTQAMIDHIEKHSAAGHEVPKNLIRDLWDDDEGNFLPIEE